MKKVLLLKCLQILLILIAIAVVAVALIEYYAEDVPLTASLPRTLFVLLVCALSFARATSAAYRPLSFYETRYSEQIGSGFAENPTARKRLIQGIRDYNKGNYTTAIRRLSSLSTQVQCGADLYPIQLIIGLTYTDMGLPYDAIDAYEVLLSEKLAASVIYSNLALLYMDLGDYERAISHLTSALELDPKSATAHSNLASVYFRCYRLEEAIKSAKQALTLDQENRPAASLLAILYAIQKNKEESERYFHIAVAAGQAPEGLRAAIRHYCKTPIPVALSEESEHPSTLGTNQKNESPAE